MTPESGSTQAGTQSPTVIAFEQTQSPTMKPSEVATAAVFFAPSVDNEPVYLSFKAPSGTTFAEDTIGWVAANGMDSGQVSKVGLTADRKSLTSIAPVTVDTAGRFFSVKLLADADNDHSGAIADGTATAVFYSTQESTIVPLSYTSDVPKAELPFVIDTPQGGDSLQPEAVTFAGTGVVGAEITIASNGETIATATVDNEGRWSTVPNAPLAHGKKSVTVTQNVNGTTTSKGIEFVVADSVDSPMVNPIVGGVLGAAALGVAIPITVSRRKQSRA